MKNSYYTHIFCNNCKSKHKVRIYDLGSQNLVRCLKCNLCYLDKQRADLKNLYNDNYYITTDNESSANYADYSAQDQVMKGNFKFSYDYIEQLSKQHKNITLLEIGAGYGYFLKYLPDNITREAVEISTKGAKEIRKAKIKVYESDILEANITNKYNCVVSFDVIEHQIFLNKYLQKVHKLLDKNGVFIFTTPDFGGLLNRIFKDKSPLIQPLYHNYYFDKKWLLDNMPKYGFELVSMKSIYTTKTSISHFLLLASFTFPFIRKLGIIQFLRKTSLGNIIVPVLRFGGIEAIFRKTKV